MTADTMEVRFPEVGQAVQVRNRLATVRAVEPYDTRGQQGRLHIVEVAATRARDLLIVTSSGSPSRFLQGIG